MNPFRPTAGKMPPMLIGREAMLSSFSDGLRGGAGAPSRLMLVTGQRGYGKTVLLTEFVRMAQTEGWETILETANTGMCERIIEALNDDGLHVSEATFSPQVTVGGIGSASLGNVKLSRREVAPTLRTLIETKLEQVDEGKGIFFAIDEAQAGSREELVALATTVQLVIQDQDLNDLPDSRKRGVAFVFAGLPSVVDDLEDENSVTFLRRCEHHTLDDISLPDVRNAYISTVKNAGKKISSATAEKAAEASAGFPYMIQLVGHYMWQASDVRHDQTINDDDVKQATKDAALAFQDAVCAPTFRSLTEPQQNFLCAMMPDYPNPSTLTDIVKRTGRSESWVKKYRRSLLDAKVIRNTGRGKFTYDVPYIDDYLRRIV